MSELSETVKVGDYVYRIELCRHNDKTNINKYEVIETDHAMPNRFRLRFASLSFTPDPKFDIHYTEEQLNEQFSDSPVIALEKGLVILHRFLEEDKKRLRKANKEAKWAKITKAERIESINRAKQLKELMEVGEQL